ncbi:MAG: methyltransferase domain-containing protein [Deltaproteobacteria bacterium]|nr:methyltransferase domain-containing protein [Deltaproteobacteria bacterium]
MADPSSVERSAFRQFERSGWENVVNEYDTSFGHLTTQAVEPLLDSVGARHGVRLLDVATGPGYVAAAAGRRGAAVIGIDFSAPMVAEGRKKFPSVEFRVGDAEALSFSEESFDAVVMNFGMLHLAHPEQALAEAHRVLRPGGRVGFTVWAKPEEAVAFAITLRAIETYGKMNVALPQGPPFFRFSEPDECIRSLLNAGFSDPRVVKVAQIWRLPSAGALFEAMRGGTVRTAGLLREQTAEAGAAIRLAITHAARAYEKAGIIELPMPAILASAPKSPV